MPKLPPTSRQTYKAVRHQKVIHGDLTKAPPPADRPSEDPEDPPTTRHCVKPHRKNFKRLGQGPYFGPTRKQRATGWRRKSAPSNATSAFSLAVKAYQPALWSYWTPQDDKNLVDISTDPVFRLPADVLAVVFAMLSREEREAAALSHPKFRFTVMYLGAPSTFFVASFRLTEKLRRAQQDLTMGIWWTADDEQAARNMRGPVAKLPIDAVVNIVEFLTPSERITTTPIHPKFRKAALQCNIFKPQWHCWYSWLTRLSDASGDSQHNVASMIKGKTPAKQICAPVKIE